MQASAEWLLSTSTTVRIIGAYLPTSETRSGYPKLSFSIFFETVSARERAAAMLPAMALSPFRERLMRGYACTRTLDRQADSLRSRMADLASDPAAAGDVLGTIRAMREALDRAEWTAEQLAAEQRD